MAMLKGLVLSAILLPLMGLPAVAETAPSSVIQLAKKKKKPASVVVTEAQVIAEDIAGTVYYTLSGRVQNRSEEPVINPLVFYEIYDEETDQIVAGGSLLAQPAVVPGNSEAAFQAELNYGGRVRITLVEWLTRDRKPKSNDQQEFFPKDTEDANADDALAPVDLPQNVTDENRKITED